MGRFPHDPNFTSLVSLKRIYLNVSETAEKPSKTENTLEW